MSIGAVRVMAEPKVRILADVSVETKQKLEEVVHAMGITKKHFFDTVIEEHHKKYVRNEK
ncbi:hypothetical protein M3225_26630 [Priestia aryabhattai]|uniref:hypothetical protein n=1 Tax=Priestia aryabhattai TaxID=412384 RepID=UPI00203EF177|nr:hypothetical protein [Priestia aryabhattai]MCM3773995.1 hypothetical protein [Priestia aryabhattai]